MAWRNQPFTQDIHVDYAPIRQPDDVPSQGNLQGFHSSRRRFRSRACIGGRCRVLQPAGSTIPDPRRNIGWTLCTSPRHSWLRRPVRSRTRYSVSTSQDSYFSFILFAFPSFFLFPVFLPIVGLPCCSTHAPCPNDCKPLIRNDLTISHNRTTPNLVGLNSLCEFRYSVSRWLPMPCADFRK